MREQSKSRKIRRLTFGGLVAALVLLSGAVPADEPERNESCAGRTAVADSDREAQTELAAQQDAELPEEKLTTARVQSGAGLKAFIDPATGRLVVPPAEKRRVLELSPQLSNALSTSHEGLRVVTLPNGYGYVDLRGRFYSATVATVGEDGKVKLHHAVPTETAAAGDAETARCAEEDKP